MIKSFQSQKKEKRHFSFFKQSQQTRKYQDISQMKNKYIHSLQNKRGQCSPEHQKRSNKIKQQYQKALFKPKVENEGQTVSKMFQTAASSFKGLQSAGSNQAHPLKIKRHNQNKHITPLIRIIIIDWLMKVTVQLKISKQVLHGTIYCLDKLTTKIHIKQQQYQLYALIALIINQKYQSKYILTIQQAIQIMQHTITQQTILTKQQEVLQLLQFKLNPCTLWIQINILLRGVQLFFMDLLAVKQWAVVKNRILWIAEGIVMQKSYNSKQINQKQTCLALIYVVLHQQYSLPPKLFETFCQKILEIDSFHLLMLSKSITAMIPWLYHKCKCQHAYDKQTYHSQLKKISALSIYY